MVGLLQARQGLAAVHPALILTIRSSGRPARRQNLEERKHLSQPAKRRSGEPAKSRAASYVSQCVTSSTWAATSRTDLSSVATEGNPGRS